MWNLTTAQQWKKTGFVWLCSVLIGLSILTFVLAGILGFEFNRQTLSFMLFVFNHTALLSIPAAGIFFLLIKYVLIKIEDVYLRNLVLYLTSYFLVCCTLMLFVIVNSDPDDFLDYSGWIFYSVIACIYCLSVNISIQIISRSADGHVQFKES